MGSSLNLSRRSFVALSAAVGAAAALSTSVPAGSALAETEAAAPEVKRIRTCCRGCGKMECGVWVTVENGRAVKIEGDETAYQSNGNCCTKSMASIQAAYHPDRLHYPMKRTNPKGEDPGWVRISWDEALTTIHEKMTELQEKYTNYGLMNMSGTSRLWASTSPSSLYNVGNSYAAAQICKGVRRTACALTIENGAFFNETVGFPRVYVQWGTGPSISNYDEAGRTATEAIERADTYILVDPRVSNEGKSADIHLQLRPGTDGAMALGWTHLVMKNHWEDHTFCTRWTNGPFLYCEDVDIQDHPWLTGKFTKGNGLYVKTRLLRECDLKEDGSPSRFMVWDSKNERLTYFDADESIGLWEGESEHHIPTEFTDYVRPSLDVRDPSKGDVSGRIPKPTQFENDIEPELWYEGEVTLKDGRTAKVKSVWKKYWDDVVEKYTPEYTGSICDVDPELIEKAVEAWCAKRFDPRFANGGIHYQLSPEQCGNSMQNFRSLCILSAIVGGYDCPGGNRGMTRVALGNAGTPYSEKSGSSSTEFVDAFTKNAKKVSAEEFPMDRWDGRSDARCTMQAMLTGEPYPIRGGFCLAGDFMSQVSATYNWEALKTLDFFVVIDLWHHPTSELADIKLPAQHWLEIPGFARLSQGAHGGFGANIHCIEAPGEARWDIEISRDLYKVAGKPYYNPNKVDDPWGSLDYYDDLRVQELGFKDAAEYRQEFQEHGWWKAKEVYPEQWGTYFRYEIGYLRQPDSSSYAKGDGMPGFSLPTMKLEIWSTIMETYLDPEIGNTSKHLEGYTVSEIAFPEFKEPPISPVSRPDLVEEYPMILTTGRRIPVYFHSEHRQLPWCREQWPAPRCEMNPKDAERLGIKQGDWVWIETKDGKVRQIADLYYGIKEGVMNAEHAWWFPEFSAPNHGWDLCSINVVCDPFAQDPFTGSSQLRALLCKVYKATPENSPFGNPCPCDVDGTPIIADASDPRLKEWCPVYEGRD